MGFVPREIQTSYSAVLSYCSKVTNSTKLLYHTQGSHTILTSIGFYHTPFLTANCYGQWSFCMIIRVLALI